MFAWLAVTAEGMGGEGGGGWGEGTLGEVENRSNISNHTNGSSAQSLPALLDRHCTIQDPYECVNTTGCGFCMNTFTCMVGDADGPAHGLTPCPDVSRCGAYCWFGDPTGKPHVGCWSIECGWASSAQYLVEHSRRRMTIQPKAMTGVHVLRPPYWPHNSSAAPAEDTICEGGGQRHWDYYEQCTTQKPPYVPYPPKDAVSWWGSNRCDCPAGRNGWLCAGCSDGIGCGDGYTCRRPGMQQLLEEGETLHIQCQINDTASQIFPSFLRTYAQGFGAEATVRFELSLGEIFMELRKGVDFPQSFMAATNTFGVDRGARPLSGVSFRARTNDSSLVDVPTIPCPTGADWARIAPGIPQPSWRANDADKCRHWHLGHMTPAAFFKTPTVTDKYYDINGWMRYDTDNAILQGELQPPLDVRIAIYLVLAAVQSSLSCTHTCPHPHRFTARTTEWMRVHLFAHLSSRNSQSCSNSTASLRARVCSSVCRPRHRCRRSLLRRRHCRIAKWSRTRSTATWNGRRSRCSCRSPQRPPCSALWFRLAAPTRGTVGTSGARMVRCQTARPSSHRGHLW